MDSFEQRALHFSNQAIDQGRAWVAHAKEILDNNETFQEVSHHVHRLAHEVMEHIGPAIAACWGFLLVAWAHARGWLDAISSKLQPHVDAAQRSAQPYLDRANAGFDELTANYSKFEVTCIVMAASLLLFWLCTPPKHRRCAANETSSLQKVFNALKRLPIVSGMVRSRLDKVKQDMKAELAHKDVNAVSKLTEMPDDGVEPEAVLGELEDRAANDFRYADGHSTATGAIYMASDLHRELLNDVYCLFSQANPLHSDMFPSVRRMEAEVVSITASILGGGRDGNPDVCGSMTSGGTESIITAMFASIAYQRSKRGITDPEIVIADSAHAAYWKAASYANARLICVPVSTKTFKMTAADVRKRLTRNTAVVVASAVSFPHGTLDDVADIAKLCRRRGCLLHVDCCLGGYVLPFMRELGYDVPPFDFAVPGVTSMSVDTHKYGLAHKGTSVVLYSNHELRRAQYTSITEWSGGLYISPGMSGSRNGALIATAWAAIRHMGMKGYTEATKEIMKAAEAFKECVQSIPELAICGSPAMCNIAFMSKSRSFNILQLNDLLSKRGWQFAPLIKPSALHFCFTLQHTAAVKKLCSDVKDACAELREAGSVSGGKAQLYGMASTIPDRQAVGDILAAYQDILLSV